MNQIKTTEQVVTTTGSAETPASYQKKKVIFRAYQVIWYILGVVETLLFFRVILKLFAANPLSGFVNFIYTLSNPFALPFYGIFRISASQGSILEWTTLFAMIVYLILAYGLVELMKFIKPVSPQEVRETVDNPDN